MKPSSLQREAAARFTKRTGGLVIDLDSWGTWEWWIHSGRPKNRVEMQAGRTSPALLPALALLVGPAWPPGSETFLDEEVRARAERSRLKRTRVLLARATKGVEVARLALGALQAEANEVRAQWFAPGADLATGLERARVAAAEFEAQRGAAENLLEQERPPSGKHGGGQQAAAPLRARAIRLLRSVVTPTGKVISRGCIADLLLAVGAIPPGEIGAARRRHQKNLIEVPPADLALQVALAAVREALR